MHLGRKRHWILLGLACVTATAQTVTLDPVIISATRTAAPLSQVPFTVTVLDEDALREAPALTIDSALRSVPSFSLFRRSDSLVAHPTTQGVSLRGLGPSGASRTLVLLDGVPLNDPFGGWINWNKVPQESLGGAEIVKNGGATAWGNTALAGVVQLTSRPTTNRHDQLAALAGSFGTYRVEADVSEALGLGIMQISGRTFQTDGFPVIARENRGPVDQAANSRHQWLTARWHQPIGDENKLTLTVRTFSESRSNGTRGQNNRSGENFFSASLPYHLSESLEGTSTAYVQSQRFASTFSSVNALRTAETPASDQFAVPATAAGAATTLTWTEDGGGRTTAGADFRAVRGEARENFFFSNGDFTRRRFAGGAQTTTGIFLQHEQPFGRNWHALFGARLDRWAEADGHRREMERADGSLLRDEIFPNRSGWEFSPTAGLIWHPAPEWRFHLSSQKAFRRPTLNELYRPFRQGNDITNANPGLSTEHVRNEELGATWTHAEFTASVALFSSDLRNAVSNVTLATGPGNFDEFGFIPAGGSGRRRLNIDHIRVHGVEATAAWKPSTIISVEAAYIFDDTEVLSSPTAPYLVGRRLAEVPRQSATLSIAWSVLPKLKIISRARWVDTQFDDDENRQTLDAYCSLDLSVVSRVSDHVELFLTEENIADVRIETTRTANGIVSTGTPRFVYAGVRLRN